MQTSQSDDAIYDRWLRELDTCELFLFAQRGQASRANFSRGRGWMKVPDSRTAKLMIAMGHMVERQRTLLEVGLAVVRAVNPHSSIAEWQSKNYETAREVLLGQYDDVELRSGPEGGRYRLRPYTRQEKFLALQALHSLNDDSVPAPGWCASRFVEAEGINMRWFWR